MLDFEPDVIVSGINSGSNMGDDTLYSGTVAAATEGYLLGIPSVAVSLVARSSRITRPLRASPTISCSAWRRRRSPRPCSST